MKSHPCAKTPGGGVCPTSEPISLSTNSQSVTSIPATVSSHAVNITPCRHINRRGHRCRLFSSIPNLDLCPHHARLLEKQSQRHNDNTASELLGEFSDFSTPDAVNALLGNLVRQLARKRIARLDAIAIAYVSQLLLGSIASMDRHDAALRAADSDDSIPGRLIFDHPDDDSPAPISDTARIAALFTSGEPAAHQNDEGRA
jgi:hypothetical protein